MKKPTIKVLSRTILMMILLLGGTASAQTTCVTLGPFLSCEGPAGLTSAVQLAPNVTSVVGPPVLPIPFVAPLTPRAPLRTFEAMPLRQTMAPQSLEERGLRMDTWEEFERDLELGLRP